MINDEALNLCCVLGISFLPEMELIFSIISIIIITGIAVFNFIIKVKKYKEDGKIDKEEQKDLLNDIEQLGNDIKDKINK